MSYSKKAEIKARKEAKAKNFIELHANGLISYLELRSEMDKLNIELVNIRITQ